MIDQTLPPFLASVLANGQIPFACIIQGADNSLLRVVVDIPGPQESADYLAQMKARSPAPIIPPTAEDIAKAFES